MEIIMNKNTLNIAIIGLGYVGLPLALEFSSKFKVTAYDLDPTRINELLSGSDRNNEECVEVSGRSNSLHFTSTASDIRDCSVYIICVPTPTKVDTTPDLTSLISATNLVGKNISKGDLIVYESTVYPGATEEICVPILESCSQLALNRDFHCGYSPERVSPGINGKKLTDIIKLTAGSSPYASDLVDDIYSKIIKAGTYRASSIRVAEASKVLENIQRDVNIALMNEFATYTYSEGIDMQDVLDAANTKWNFLSFYPGLVGGHCIAVDPYYLIHRAKSISVDLPLISTARTVNNSMVYEITSKVIKKMITLGILIKNSRVLIMGLAFKEDCNDTRNSKVYDLIESLQDYNLHVDVFDPLLPIDSNDSLIDNPFNGSSTYSAVINCVNHQNFEQYTKSSFDAILNDPGFVFNVSSMTIVD
jgi:UDP-N-acetyl-D-galactosamine dehydrogenase